MQAEQAIYMDYSATTPTDKRVVDAMLPYWADAWGNPSSAHQFGQAAKMGLETARRTIAELLNARPAEIVFTGSGSEADNLALRGVMLHARESGRGEHLIISPIEHEAVHLTALQLADQLDFELTILPITAEGLVEPADLRAAIRPDTALVSIMAANNEIGTQQPIRELGEICRAHDVVFHTDAVQAAQYIDWDLSQMPIDLMSLAPHKFYGPKGVGIFYIRQGTPILPTMTGGGQENGQRAGTVNVPFAVGAAKAFELAMADREENNDRLVTLRDNLIEKVTAVFPADQVRLTGHRTHRMPHHASFAFKDIPGGDLVMHLDLLGIAASSGSACSSGNPVPSAVLQAIGLDDHWNAGGLRVSLGKHSTAQDIDALVEKLPQAIDSLEKFSTVMYR